MAEVDVDFSSSGGCPQYIDLKRTFVDLTGRQISHGAELDEGGLKSQYGRIQEIADRLDNDEVSFPGDWLLAEGCADLALNWYHRRKASVVSGLSERVELDGLAKVRKELKAVDESDPCRRDLICDLWYRDPARGAAAAIKVLGRLNELRSVK